MSTARATADIAMFSRFHDAVNTGDAEVISKTIDEVVEPDAVFHAPVPAGARGAQALRTPLSKDGNSIHLWLTVGK